MNATTGAARIMESGSSSKIFIIEEKPQKIPMVVPRRTVIKKAIMTRRKVARKFSQKILVEQSWKRLAITSKGEGKMRLAFIKRARIPQIIRIKKREIKYDRKWGSFFIFILNRNPCREVFRLLKTCRFP